jgi:sRNA-binding carbon storage regulator CsrA
MSNRNDTLTLTRASGDAVRFTTVFGEEIEILFHAFSDKQCKISINAPREVHIMRMEELDEEHTKVDDEKIYAMEQQ